MRPLFFELTLLPLAKSLLEFTHSSVNFPKEGLTTTKLSCPSSTISKIVLTNFFSLRGNLVAYTICICLPSYFTAQILYGLVTDTQLISQHHILFTELSVFIDIIIDLSIRFSELQLELLVLVTPVAFCLHYFFFFVLKRGNLK